MNRIDTALAPHTLRQYALLADGERGCVVGPRGEYAWMCFPAWDSESVFTDLLGAAGSYTVTPAHRHVWGGAYEEGTLIWRSRWVTTSSTLECREALTFPGQPRTAILLRRLSPVHGVTPVHIALDPCRAYGRKALSALHQSDGVWTARLGDLRVRWSGAPEAHVEKRSGRNSLVMDITVDTGAQRDLVLELSLDPLSDVPPDASDLWSATEGAWRTHAPHLQLACAERDARHAYDVLRGLTSSHGGMVAAVTTSLPERADAGRNYDYRYAWVRDQCYAGVAAAAAGGEQILDDAVRFVGERLLDHGDHMHPAYRADGGRVPAESDVDVPGYPGAPIVHVGNHAARQFQLDAFGEALLLLAAAARCDRLESDGWKAADAAAAAIERRWQEDDAGLWELENRRWTHSRLACVAGLRGIAGVAPGAAQSRWLALADRILADVAASSLHPSGRWQRSPADP
ncbi:MAG: glycoside hydrolase family 15 protein, partial [Candidatus Dormibacteria bacterium]